MMKILSYIISTLFAFTFILLLLIFHPLQWISLKVFGYTGHKKVVDLLNGCLTKSMLILGVPVKFINHQKLPENTTLIFVSNHQSSLDIPPLGWFLRKYHPKFVSKIELGKGIPSVSFNLKHGGAALIDRKDGKKAIATLINFAKRINKNKWAAVIFPEGTRSKDGTLKKFHASGLKVLCKLNPEGYVVPITINNSYKLFKYGSFPLGIGAPMSITTHKPIKINSLPFDELIEQTEAAIKSNLNTTNN